MMHVCPTFWVCPLLACAYAIAATASNGQSLSPTPAASHNNSAAVTRDPFWPVGYVPKSRVVEATPGTSNVSATTGAVVVIPVTPAVTVEESVVWPELKTRGIMHDRAKGKYWATMDGVGIVEVGDTPEITKGSYVYRFEIKAITATGVSYEKTGVRKVVRKSGK